MMTGRRRRLIVRTVLCAFAATGLVACGDSKDESEPQPAASKPKPAKPKTAVVGQPLALTGQAGKANVTAVRVIDPLAAGTYDKPRPGNRYVGVQLRIANTGGTAYDGSPSNGTRLLLAPDDAAADPTILSGGPCAKKFASAITIAPGTAKEGCVAFQVLEDGKVGKVQFTLDPRFGQRTGEWTVR